jgi:prevent-host-death family protein
MKKSSWELQDAKNRLSEVVRKAREEGPQTITLHGNDLVVVVDAGQFDKLTRSPRGSLIDFFRESPLRGAKLNISRLEREHTHLTLLDEASRGWEDVEQGRTISVERARAKYEVRKKR